MDYNFVQCIGQKHRLRQRDAAGLERLARLVIA